MSTSVSRTALALALFTLVGCATTTFTSTWKAPDAQPVGPLKGKKVVAFVATKNPAARRSAEDALARQISLNGAEGVPGYTLVDDSQVSNEAQARAALEKSGAVGVVVMRPLAKDISITSTPAVYTGPMYGPYWGGYYSYGWGAPWTMGPEIRTDTIVTVETLVYSLQQNKLIWAGQSQTTNPGKVDDFVRELAVGAAKEMKKAGLL